MKQNKARIIGALSTLIVVILVLLIVIGVMKYIITNNEPNNNIVSKVNKNTNTLNVQEKNLNDLPKNYNMQDAISDGCFTIANNNVIYNKKTLDNFIDRLNANKGERQDTRLRIAQFTTEGDMIITDIEYKVSEYIESGKTKKKGSYIVTKDNTRDKWSAENDRKIETNDDIPEEYYDFVLEEQGDIIDIKLKLLAEINYIEGAKMYEDIYLCSYSKNANIIEEAKSFFGKIVESQKDYIIVELNEDEEIRKSSDQVIISFVENNDITYKLGTNVKITYSGFIMETYPAKIDAINIEIKSVDNFEIFFTKSQESSEKDIILTKQEMEDYNYNIYSYGGSVEISINDEKMSLREALLNNKITMDEIIQKANNDLENEIIKGGMYRDGGSMIYQYDSYTIIKYHDLEGNRDVYIGSPEMKMGVK